MDDGDSNLEEDGLQFCTEDELDQIFQQELMIQRYIERQIQLERQRMMEEQQLRQPCCSHCKERQSTASDSEPQPRQSKEETIVSNTTYSRRCSPESIVNHSSSFPSSSESRLVDNSSSNLPAVECSCSKLSKSEGRESKNLVASLTVKPIQKPTIMHSSKIIANNNEISVVIDDS